MPDLLVVELVCLHCGEASNPPANLTFTNYTVRFLTPISWKISTDSSLNLFKKKKKTAWLLLRKGVNPFQSVMNEDWVREVFKSIFAEMELNTFLGSPTCNKYPNASYF